MTAKVEKPIKLEEAKDHAEAKDHVEAKDLIEGKIIKIYCQNGYFTCFTQF